MKGAESFSSAEIETARTELRRPDSELFSLARDGWLSRSLREPAAFQTALLAHTNERSAPLKSRPGEAFDFFHDLVLRNPGRDNPVLRTYSRRAGWSVLTPAALRQRAVQLATLWSRAGVKPGERLAIVLPLGTEYVVAFAAALYLGLVIAPLPPRGSLLMTLRLSALKPDRIHTSALLGAELRRLRGVPKLAERLLIGEPDSPLEGMPAAPHTYAPGAPVLALFSPLYKGNKALVEVSSERAFFGALRDLSVGLGLELGETLAAPGVFPEQYHPGLVLAALLGGLTLFDCELSALRSEPQLLLQQPIDALLVSRPLFDILSGVEPARGVLARTRLLLRDPLAATDLAPWQRLTAAHGLGKHLLGNLVYDSAEGGCLLFSPRRRGQWQTLVLPAPGRPYELQVPDDSQRPAVAGSGVFLPAEAPQGYAVVGRVGDDYLLAGTLTPRQDGRVYPEAEILLALQAQPGLPAPPFIDGAAVATVPSGDGSDRWLFILLILTGAEPLAEFGRLQGERSEELQQRLRTLVGPEFLPHAIVMYPLFARRVDGQVDTERIARDYQAGTLHRKASQPLFHHLTMLRAACRDTPLLRLAKLVAAGSAPPESPC